MSKEEERRNRMIESYLGLFKRTSNEEKKKTYHAKFRKTLDKLTEEEMLEYVTNFVDGVIKKMNEVSVRYKND